MAPFKGGYNKGASYQNIQKIKATGIAFKQNGQFAMFTFQMF